MLFLDYVLYWVVQSINQMEIVSLSHPYFQLASLLPLLPFLTIYNVNGKILHDYYHFAVSKTWSLHVVTASNYMYSMPQAMYQIGIEFWWPIRSRRLISY